VGSGYAENLRYFIINQRIDLGNRILPSHVPHGWRALFSTSMNEWAERNGTPGDRHVIDLMLAHVQKGYQDRKGPIIWLRSLIAAWR
jgi:hypothetical protein